MPLGQESLVIIVDYASTTLHTNPSISVARKVQVTLVCANTTVFHSLPFTGTQHPTKTLRRDTRPGTDRKPSPTIKFLLQRHLAFPRSSDTRQGGWQMAYIIKMTLTI